MASSFNAACRDKCENSKTWKCPVLYSVCTRNKENSQHLFCLLHLQGSNVADAAFMMPRTTDVFNSKSSGRKTSSSLCKRAPKWSQNIFNKKKLLHFNWFLWILFSYWSTYFWVVVLVVFGTHHRHSLRETLLWRIVSDFLIKEKLLYVRGMSSNWRVQFDWRLFTKAHNFRDVISVHDSSSHEQLPALLKAESSEVGLRPSWDTLQSPKFIQHSYVIWRTRERILFCA